MMFKERFEVENLKYVLRWIGNRNLFVDPVILSGFLGISKEQLYHLAGKIDVELSSRIICSYKNIGYINYNSTFDSLVKFYESIGLELVKSIDFFEDDKVYKARAITQESLIVKAINFIDSSSLQSEMQFSSELLGNFGVLPEQKDAIYFMPSDTLTQKLDLDNRPKVVVKGSSSVQKKLLSAFLSSESGEIEMSDLYLRVYGGDLKDFYDDRNKLYVLIKAFNQAMKVILSAMENEGLNLERISLTKKKDNIYEFILLNKEDTKDTSICHLNYLCNGKIPF